MKREALLLGVLALIFAGCASDSGARDGSKDRVMRKRRSAAANQGSFDSSSGARQMTVDNELGIYEAREVEEALAGHVGAIRECYGRAGKAQRYVGGNVTLRFLVSGQGTPTDVLVVTSDLGNYEVERCLVAVGRQVKFPPPEGHKATTFDYPVEFRSSGQMEVQDLDDSLKLDRDVAAFLPSLAECGRVAEGGASALLWVEPNGAVGSVGLAAEEPLDESAGSCVVKGIRRWKMSATLPGRVLRCRVSIPAVIAAAEPPPSRPSALSASVRRKRR